MSYKAAADSQAFLNRTGSYSIRPSRRGYDPDAQASIDHIAEQYDALVEKQKNIQLAISEINEKLQSAKRRARVLGKFLSIQEMDQLEGDRRRLVREFEQISLDLRKMKREKAKASAHTPNEFNNTFVNVAKEMLDQPTFQALLQETKERIESAGWARANGQR